MDYGEKSCLLWFHRIYNLGRAGMEKIYTYFGSFEKGYQAGVKDWTAAGISLSLAENMAERRRALLPDEIMPALDRCGQKVLCWCDPDYPERLRSIPRYPYAIYCIGSLELLSRPSIAIVGARRSSSYGRNVARQLAADLSCTGTTVVSGMARGIDSEAHHGALTGRASTVAVLGSGLDQVYPAENRSLFQSICSQGTAISEYPPGTPPLPANFPARNRIISGLSCGIVVVEAREKSGSLITADFGLEQGRDVMAVPGPVTSPLSAGTHGLIKQGARLVACVEDIWEETGLLPLAAGQDKNSLETGQQMKTGFGSLDLDERQRVVIKLLENGPLNIDGLMAQSGWDIGSLATVLLQLEIYGLVKSRPGNYYIMSTSQ